MAHPYRCTVRRNRLQLGTEWSVVLDPKSDVRGPAGILNLHHQSRPQLAKAPFCAEVPVVLIRYSTQFDLNQEYFIQFRSTGGVILPSSTTKLVG